MRYQTRPRHRWPGDRVRGRLDVPFLHAETLGRILKSLEQAEFAAPFADGYFHPLAAAYRLSVLPRLIELRAAGDLLQPLFELVPTARVTVDARELCNVNTPADYEAALQTIET